MNPSSVRTRAVALSLALTLLTQAAWSQPLPAPTLPPPPPAAQAAPPPPPAPPPPAQAPIAPPAPPAAPAASALSLTAPGPRRPAFTRDRLRLLDTQLIPLAERSRDSRVTSSIISLAVGGGLIALGFVLQSESTSGPAPLQYIFWFQGGFELATGVVDLAWVPARERLSRDYAAMPRATAQDRRAAVRYGEQAMDEIAADGSRRRVLSSLASTGFSLATLGLIYREQIFDGAPMPEPPAVNYLLIGLVGIQVVVSLLGLLRRSDDERMRDIYRAQAAVLRRQAAQE